MVIDEVTLVNTLRIVCLIIDTIGIAIGLDLIIGAPVIFFLNRILNKVVDFDKALGNRKTRVSLGILFVIVSGIMLCVTIRTR